jgi:hypothetical protein
VQGPAQSVLAPSAPDTRIFMGRHCTCRVAERSCGIPSENASSVAKRRIPDSTARMASKPGTPSSLRSSDDLRQTRAQTHHAPLRLPPRRLAPRGRVALEGRVLRGERDDLEAVVAAGSATIVSSEPYGGSSRPKRPRWRTSREPRGRAPRSAATSRTSAVRPC